MNGRVAVAVDLGGTKTAMGLVDQHGTVLYRTVAPTPALDGGDRVMDTVIGLVRDGVARAHHGRLSVAGCGIGTAGVVSSSGTIEHATRHLENWVGVDVRGRIEEAVGLPVTVINDVHASAICEARIGAARGSRSALMMAVGTGIGGAILIDGALYPGPTRTAGSLGHLPAVGFDDERVCSCGATGHIEAYASGPALEQDYRRRGGADLGLAAIGEYAAGGDAVARATISESAFGLGLAVGGAATMLDVDRVVVGGGVAQLGELFLGPLRAGIAAEVFPRGRLVPVEPASRGADAGLVGAGLIAFDAVRR